MTLRTRTAGRMMMMLGVSALALSGTASSALANGTPEPEYPPLVPTAASGVCVGDIPFFSYQADFGPANAGRTISITFVNPNGDDVVFTGLPLKGSVLWPGASKNPPDWPGWVLEDGVWVESTTDVGAFTRVVGGVTVIFALEGGGGTAQMATGLVAPIVSLFQDTTVIPTTVTYPPATVACANPPNSDNPGPTPTPTPGQPGTPTTTTTTPGLPATGGQTAALLLVGGGLLAGGTALVVSSRRRGANDTV